MLYQILRMWLDVWTIKELSGSSVMSWILVEYTRMPSKRDLLFWGVEWRTCLIRSTGELNSLVSFPVFDIRRILVWIINPSIAKSIFKRAVTKSHKRSNQVICLHYWVSLSNAIQFILFDALQIFQFVFSSFLIYLGLKKKPHNEN